VVSNRQAANAIRIISNGPFAPWAARIWRVGGGGNRGDFLVDVRHECSG